MSSEDAILFAVALPVVACGVGILGYAVGQILKGLIR